MINEILHHIQKIDFSSVILSYIFFIFLIGLGGLFRIKAEISIIRPSLGLSILFFLIFALLINNTSLVTKSILIILIILSLIGLVQLTLKNREECLEWLLIMITSFPVISVFSVRDDFGWDGYTTWLPMAKYFFENMQLPSEVLPAFSYIKGYPYGVPLQYSLVSILNNEFTEISATALNGIWAFSLTKWFISNKAYISNKVRVLFVSLPVIYFWQMCLGEKLPGDPVVEPILSVAFVHFGLWIFSLREKNNINVRDLTISILLALNLVFMKDAGWIYAFVLVSVFFATSIFFKHEDKRSLKSYFIIFFGIVSSSLLQQLIWRHYLEINNISAPFHNIGAIGTWKWDIWLDVMLAVLMQTNHRPFWVLFPILLLIWEYIHFRKINKGDTLLLSSFLSMSRNAYLSFNMLIASFGVMSALYFIYLAAFSAYEASNAASFPRYMSPLGALSGLLLWNSVLNRIYREKIQNSWRISISGIGIYLSFFVAIGALQASGRLNETIDTSNTIKVAQYLRDNIRQDSRVFVIDENGNCLNGSKLQYYTSGRFKIVGNNCVYGAKNEPQHLIDEMKALKINYLIFFSYGGEWKNVIDETISIPTLMELSDNGKLISTPIN